MIIAGHVIDRSLDGSLPGANAHLLSEEGLPVKGAHHQAIKERGGFFVHFG